MRPAALPLFLLLLLPPMAPLHAHGPRRPGGSAPLQRRRQSTARRAPHTARLSNLCGEACCPGWSVAPKTGKCTKAVCTPRCQNGGRCHAPQQCSCRPGFAGPRCESSPPAPTVAPQPPPSLKVRWQPLTLSELELVLRRRKALDPTEKMATILAQHLASHHGGSPPALPGRAPAVTPRPHVLCPLICHNGGVCLKKDQCLCPPRWTGKFCHIPAPPLSQGQGPSRRGAAKLSPSERTTRSMYTLPLANHRQERDGVASVANVHVEHPPEASVTIHQVERVDERPPGDPNALPLSRPALYSVLAQSSSRDPGGYGEDSGFGYCFRHLQGGECSAPLPGLRTREICCRGTGVAWGVHDCQPCSSGDRGDPGAVGRNEVFCPQGFRRQNGSCVDVDECHERLSFCRNGVCTNTRGSFTCVCHEGFLLDSSRSSCISHHVISEAKGPCFRVLREGGCSLPILRNITKQICCCSRVGKAWGHGCEGCPPFSSDGFKEICPAGPGYHYSASDLRFDTRYLGQDVPRVPVSHQPRGQEPVAVPPTATAPVFLLWSPPPTVLQERQPPGAVPTPPPQPSAAAPEAGQGVCERRPQVCGPGRCIPRQGGYTCVCDRGYWLSPQGTHCVDVDECRRTPRPCANGYCENTRGSYSCRCRAGYQAVPSGVDCQDIDECAKSPPLCAQGHCQNTLGSFRCSCPPGFHPDPAGSECRDIDECSQSPSPCARGRCENVPGSYRCACPTGYQLGPRGTECQDVDECQESPPICHPGRCENVPGGHRCTCPIGYQASPQGTRCVDVDECQQEPPPCGSGRCENVPGGYRCLCPPGLRASLTENQCLDVDECTAGSPCGPHGLCTNTEGSFLCQCWRGYQMEGPEGPCADINECLEGDFCFPRGECLNTDGSYTCLCAQGFATGPSEASCVDIDECQSGTVCAGGHCANTEGSFSCYCPPGTRSSPNKASCEDINECQEYGAALCGAQRCENSPGSYRCVAECQPGFQVGPNGDCEDVDECQLYGAQVCGEKPCQNSPGSYRCVASCPSGYQGTAAGDCLDVDECRNSSQCGPHAVCHNLPGTFQCVCDQGYESARDGHHCLARPPAFPRPPEPHPAGPGDGTRRECYYDPNAAQACEDVLAGNATRQECCCTLGHGWGLDCHVQACPAPGTAEFRTLCPRGNGFATVGSGGATSALADVDECSLFSAQVCKGGVCVNKVPGYTCYCPSGYYYEAQHLECIDNDECLDEEAEPCVGGPCINTIGSYYCSCAPPLVLDASQHRCVANDSQDANLAMCWQEVGPDLVCSRPRLDRQVTYTECCCLFGEAWSMDCALCPARDSEDFEALCNVLRPPSYGPVRPGGLGLPFEYGDEEFVPYSPEIFAPPARPAPRLPDYDPYPRDSLYGVPPYEASYFEDLPYGDVRQEGLGEPSRGGYAARSLPQPEWRSTLRSRSRGSYERPGRASEDYRRSEDLGAAHSEECGILSGCENGRCVRVPDGFTCLCHEGYRLDPARMACLDIDECVEAEGLCPGGECFNVDGLYRCLCPHGMAPVGHPPHCAPAPRSRG
ncbi:latent-transforming growth factor beta-binding protein 4 isoform X2 [Paroedura picta]|uniref:latent-transforming growth factor beta-binding protein 4 isoform X2 n=1 Tax=Paroedura picta TaxID=143630 RepID=UPI004057A58D